jgi:thiol:disulfide interchange protein DsbA
MVFPRLAMAAICLISTLAFASPSSPINGAEYVTLKTAQAVQTTGARIEVVEFFMYHCPFCNALEPELAAWVKKQGGTIAFRRVHIPYTGQGDPEAHLFLTLQAMNKVDLMTPKILNAVHVERKRLMKDDAIIEWVGTSGLDKAEFLNTWNSFGVMTALRRLPRVINDYGVESAPTLVVNGRYLTSPTHAGSRSVDRSPEAAMKQTIEVLDALVAKARADSAAAK